ncbi:hypothetical protein ONZ43_g2558 [Nemania bipapillata]|uniref:Uncharacterized protein n=1 Tax=Nemania bipapillata TaxID=110536 RepID=A0ACC2J0J0_9PEZI|nr:hypothetical protein ONZ43_g2558 [Nemania bipapillata]
MDNRANSSTSSSQNARKSKHQSKKDKEAARKKQQNADLAYIGTQFQQGNQANQSSDSMNYPETIDLD